MELSRAQLREFARDMVAVSLSHEVKVSLYNVVTGAVMVSLLPCYVQWRNAKKNLISRANLRKNIAVQTFSENT